MDRLHLARLLSKCAELPKCGCHLRSGKAVDRVDEGEAAQVLQPDAAGHAG